MSHTFFSVVLTVFLPISERTTVCRSIQEAWRRGGFVGPLGRQLGIPDR